MHPSDFTEDRWGRLVCGPAGYWAFVPNPLPPRLELSWELVGRLSAADRAASELAGVARNLPNPHLLIGPFLRREAVLSSQIEGTQASLSDLFFFEASGDVPPQAPDVREVANYVRALEYALARLKELPLSLRLLRETHGVLMEGVRGEHLTPGEFRRSQNWIGRPGCSLSDATYVPPPVPEMLDALSDVEKFLHRPSELPPLIRLALVHYQFEAVHPFLDGNGRIGRLLITLLLCHERLLPEPLLYLSAFFERRRQDYYRLLLDVSRRGKWAEWIDFFLEGVAEQSQDAIRRTRKLLDLWEEYRRTAASVSSSSSLLRIVDMLFELPAITTTKVAEQLGITRRAAGMSIDKLVQAGILVEATGRARGRIFLARGIAGLAEAATADEGGKAG